ncbi:MAG: SPOR domain-containing protein [Woeseia sp.]|nr:SPOR domain-containing protein [Woeseia sp.]NNL54268.1 SPOR domain-containing protein [Woeseia sp.]
MRNLLLLLLLANALYFMWSQYSASPEETGIAIVHEEDLGPPLQLAEAILPENAGEDGGETFSGRPSALEAQVGRSCVSLGPFLENEEAEEALADYQQAGLRGALRATEGEVFVGHWVQIREIEDRATANSMLAELKNDGLNEAYVVQTEDEGIKISLGLFSDLTRAERVELQAEALDLPADITPRMRDQNVVYVDLGLPPGRGAGSMIERFGEDRVLLRDAATCPGSD